MLLLKLVPQFYSEMDLCPFLKWSQMNIKHTTVFGNGQPGHTSIMIFITNETAQAFYRNCCRLRLP